MRLARNICSYTMAGSIEACMSCNGTPCMHFIRTLVRDSPYLLWHMYAPPTGSLIQNITAEDVHSCLFSVKTTGGNRIQSYANHRRRPRPREYLERQDVPCRPLSIPNHRSLYDEFLQSVSSYTLDTPILLIVNLKPRIRQSKDSTGKE